MKNQVFWNYLKKKKEKEIRLVRDVKISLETNEKRERYTKKETARRGRLYFTVSVPWGPLYITLAPSQRTRGEMVAYKIG